MHWLSLKINRGCSEVYVTIDMTVKSSILAAAFFAAAPGLVLVACSSSNSSPANATTGGNGNAAGGSSSSGGTSSTGTMITAKSDEVGRFSVTLFEASTAIGNTVPAYTYVSGVIRDGVTPLGYTTTQVAQDGTCTLYSISVPSCTGITGGCGTGVCVATDTCKALPTAKNAGTVTITGVGTSAISMVNISNNYQYGGDIAYPGFAEGDTITLSSGGADYAAFTVSAKGIAPLKLSTDTYNLSKTSPLNLAWTAAGSLSDARILVNLNLSHHAGSTGLLSCDVADTGSLTISASLISQLINLGVAGFPTLTVTRTSLGWVSITPGSVAFDVSSPISRTVTVDGYVSCTSNADCTSGTCNTDMKLCE